MYCAVQPEYCELVAHALDLGIGQVLGKHQQHQSPSVSYISTYTGPEAQPTSETSRARMHAPARVHYIDSVIHAIERDGMAAHMLCALRCTSLEHSFHCIPELTSCSALRIHSKVDNWPPCIVLSATRPFPLRALT